MDTPHSDTPPVIAAVQLRLLQAASFERRASLAQSLTDTVIELSRRELRKRDPQASEQELLLRWAGQNYGHALEQQVRAYLARRTP